MVKWAKANPGKLTISTSGTGGIWHEVAMQIAEQIGIKVQFVPYKGGKPATLAGLQGETMIAGGGVHEHIELIRAGKLRNLFQCGTADIKLADGKVLHSIGTLVPKTKPLLPLGGNYNLLMRRTVPVGGPEGDHRSLRRGGQVGRPSPRCARRSSSSATSLPARPPTSAPPSSRSAPPICSTSIATRSAAR